jgi:GTP-binding protein HflX
MSGASHKGGGKSAGRPTRAPRERALVAAILLPESDAGLLADPLAEISGLVRAAGAEVVGGLMQRLPRPQARAAFGAGKIGELKEMAAGLAADLVVVDFDLSPSQGRHLEEDLGCRVVDRTELILDIFAHRAQSRQAKLQVELAQLTYLRTRLRRMWTHLERTEGAIGTRGPGETQLESDRRLIDQKITELRARLKEIEARRHREALAREHPEMVSLVGYTNAGKSSLMRALTGAEVYVADRLFATLDTRVRARRLRDRRRVLLADTVGFVRDLPHHLIASFHATLEETLNADLLLQVADASDPLLDSHLAAVAKVLAELGAEQIPRLLVLNKSDRLDGESRLLLSRAHPEALFTSTQDGDGMQELDAEVARRLDAWSLCLTVEVPAGAGKLLAGLRSIARVVSEEWQGENWAAQLVLPPRPWQALRADLEQCGGRWRVTNSSPNVPLL